MQILDFISIFIRVPGIVILHQKMGVWHIHKQADDYEWESFSSFRQGTIWAEEMEHICFNK